MTAGIRRGTTVLLVLFAVLVALVILIRLILDPIATHETRKALGQMHGFRGDFKRVHVTIFGPGYEITHIKLVQTEDQAAVEHREPIFYADRVLLSLQWRHLLHGRLVADVRLDEPKVVIPQTPEEKAKKPPAPAPDLSRQLSDAIPLKVDRIEVFRGEVLFRQGPVREGNEKEGEGPHQAQLWIHKLELTAQNLATRAPLTGGRAATISAHGQLARSGDLTLFVSADPLASPLSFAGQLSVVGLRASDLYEFIEPKTHLQVSKGTVDVFAEFASKDGVISGGVKPVLKNIEVRPAESGVWNHVKAWLADKAVEIASDRVPGRNAIATTVPIKGRLTDPDIQLWPAVLGVIRNAFVEGLTSGFSNLPPETADKKEGTLTQAKNAVSKSKGPPKAQPLAPQAAK